jgi:hypothetical protein
MCKSLKIIIFTYLILFIDLGLYGINDAYSPIPTSKMSITDELKYIVDTDQKDREFILDSLKTYSGLMDINDSIRLTRVIELDTSKLIQTNIQKYYAAIIYQHSGGSRMKDDIDYCLRVINLCDEILKSDSNEIQSDTISLKVFNDEMQRFNTYKILFFELTKVDTVLDNNSFDTLLIISRPIKYKARGLKQLAESQYQKLSGVKEESININDLDDPEYLKNSKEQLKAKIIKSFHKKLPFYTLSDEQADQLVEECLQELINFKKGIMEDIKKHPEKYFNNNVIIF